MNSQLSCFSRSIFPIHPSFRVLALAEPPIAGASTNRKNSQQWLNAELLPMFLYHTVTPLTKAEEMDLILGLVRQNTKFMHLSCRIFVFFFLENKVKYCIEIDT